MWKSLKFLAGCLVVLSLMAMVSASSAGEPNQGAFSTCYVVSSGKLGDVTATLHAVVSPPTKSVHGTITLAQATPETKPAVIPVDGAYMDMGRTTLVVAAGAQAHTAAMMRLELNEGWGKPGKGYCSYFWKDRSGVIEPKATPCKTP